MKVAVRRLPVCLTAAVLAIAACAGGCGGKVTLQSWQHAVETYVLQEGNGDAGVLRNVTIAGGQRGFAVLGKAKASDSHDAVGLLMAHRAAGGRQWFIYLLGLVRKGDLVELRLAALGLRAWRPAAPCEDHDDGFVWVVGDDQQVGFDHYADYHRHAWATRHAGRPMPPPYRAFPRPGDRFQVVFTEPNVQVTHVPSGAKWNLTLPAAAQRLNPKGGGR